MTQTQTHELTQLLVDWSNGDTAALEKLLIVQRRPINRFHFRARYQSFSSSKNDDAEFRPSAAAIHPIEKHLYILASAGSLLVITDLKGKVLEAFNLNPDLYPQPEGIAFSPDGTMYISNEGKYGKPNLLVFPYNRKQETAEKKQ